MSKSKYIQVGIIAARSPDGEFLTAKPIYRERTPEIEEAESAAYDEVAGVFADKLKQYIDAGGLKVGT